MPQPEYSWLIKSISSRMNVSLSSTRKDVNNMRLLSVKIWLAMQKYLYDSSKQFGTLISKSAIWVYV